jgi:hypothetical protein
MQTLVRCSLSNSWTINVPQSSKDNTWPNHPKNQNYRMWFKRQSESNYLLGIHDRIFKKWLENLTGLMDNTYESPFLIYITKDDTWIPILNALNNNELRVHQNESNKEDD